MIPILVQVVCTFGDLLDLLLIPDSQTNLPFPSSLWFHSPTCLLTVFSTYFTLTALWCNNISRTTPKNYFKAGAEQDILWESLLLKCSPFTAQLSTNSSTLSVTKPVIRRYFLMDELRLVKGLSGSIENTGHAGFTDTHKQNLNTKNTSKAHKNHFQTLTNMICAQTRAKRSQELTCFTQLCSIHWPGTAFN